MEKGREAGQRVHEFLMNLESSHMSFYERYYENLSYDKMLKGEKKLTDLQISALSLKS